MSNSVSHDTTNKDISMSTGKIPMSEHEQTSFADKTINTSNNASELHNKPDLTHNDLPASASQEMNNPQHETEPDTEAQNTSPDTTHATSFENEPSDPTQQTTKFLVQNNKTLMVNLHADILDLKIQQLLSFRS